MEAAPENPQQESATPLTDREKAIQILRGSTDRLLIRQELCALRERELKQLLHEAAVRDASPFWREIALRRFIRERALLMGKGAPDGRQDP